MRKKTWRWPLAARKALSERLRGKPPANINYATRKMPTKKYFTDDVRVRKCFKWMQERCRRNNRRCAFTYDSLGFTEFQQEMGPIPDTIKRPSVGRIDHDIGYEKGNIKWEEYSYNRWKNRRPERQEPKEEDAIPF